MIFAFLLLGTCSEYTSSARETKLLVSKLNGAVDTFYEYKWQSVLNECDENLVLPGTGGPGFFISEDEAAELVTLLIAEGDFCTITIYTIPGTSPNNSLACSAATSYEDCLARVISMNPGASSYSSKGFAKDIATRLLDVNLTDIVLYGVSYSARVAAEITILGILEIDRLVLNAPLSFSHKNHIPDPYMYARVFLNLKGACLADADCKRKFPNVLTELTQKAIFIEGIGTSVFDNVGRPVLKLDLIRKIQRVLANEGPIAAIRSLHEFDFKASTQYEGYSVSQSSHFSRTHFELVMCNDFETLDRDEYIVFDLGVYGARWGDPRQFICGKRLKQQKPSTSSVPVLIFFNAYDPIVDLAYAYSYLEIFSCIELQINEGAYHSLLPTSLLSLKRGVECTSIDNLKGDLNETIHSRYMFN
ncbi:hypothetical protein KO489_10050 [Reinekea forsetii]|nr:hypothetical protein [Reinekea forsetii]